MTNSFLSQEEIEALLKETPPGTEPAIKGSMDQGRPGQPVPIPGPGVSAPAPGAEVMSIHNQNLNLILDIPLKLTVLLGRSRHNIADVLKLSKGSIVELDRLENEPVDILVNDTLIARGEVVVVREYFGVRITDIISAENRIKSLVSP